MIVIITIIVITFSLGIWLISDPAEKGNKKFGWGILFLILSFTTPTVFSLFAEGILSNILAIIVFVIFATIIIQGIIFIPNTPITEAVITKYGEICWKKEKKTVSKSHGYRFLFLRGIVYDCKLIEITKINLDLGKEQVTTPKDNAISFVPSQCTYTPGSKDCEGETINYYNFLKAGGKAGVENILKDQIAEKIRIWASSEVEGPKTWQDLRGAGDEAISVLIKLIGGETLEPISFVVPTWKLFQYYNYAPFYPSEKKTEQEERDEITVKINALTSDEEKKSLKERVKKRWDVVLKLRQGNGTQEIPSLGITLNRFNIGQIELDKRIQEAIEKESIETAEAKAEKIELDNIKARIFELMFEVDEDGKIKKDAEEKPIRTGISEQAAIELIQSERGKVPKTINVNRKEIGFDKTTLEMVGNLANVIISSIQKKGGSE